MASAATPRPPDAAGAGGDVPGKATDTPPIVRSTLETAGKLTMFISRYMNGTPGLHLGLLHKGGSYCLSMGYRSAERGQDMDDKGNHLKMKDPMLYDALSTPIACSYVWDLYDAGTLDINCPVGNHVPELKGDTAWDNISLADLMSQRVALSDAAAFRMLGATALPVVPYGGARAVRGRVWAPVAAALKAGTPQQSRALLMDKVLLGAKALRPRRLTPGGSCTSHVAFSVLAMAVERTQKKPFEEAIQEGLFAAMGLRSAGHGVPAVHYDDRLFYQAGGQANGHYKCRSGASIPLLDEANAAPLAFNASLNLYAGAEDFAQLLTKALDKVAFNMEGTAERDRPLHTVELGLSVRGKDGHVVYRPSIVGIKHPPLPWSVSLQYNYKKKYGAFCVLNSGSKNAQYTATMGPKVMSKLFETQCLDANVFDEDGKLRGEDPNAVPGEEEGEAKQKDRMSSISNFLRQDRHRNL